jgi:glyoxylase-like metal-dependent hydrolase (beta-lactamase superfamily II)
MLARLRAEKEESMAIERVTVGSVDIVSVIDGVMRGPPSFFFSGIPPELYTPALGDDLGEDGMLAVKFGSFLVRSSGKTILIDTGAGVKNPLMRGGELLKNLEALGVRLNDIDVVINTHLHIDHVGWNCTETGQPTFPKAEYWIARKEWDYWTEPEIAAEEAYVPTDVLPLKDSPQLRLVDGEAAITPEVSLLPTPGHTPGHSSIAIASGGETAIVLGDVAHHPAHLIRLWIASVDELPRISRRTKRALVERLIKEQILVAGGHFSPHSFGRIVQADGQRAWQPLVS